MNIRVKSPLFKLGKALCLLALCVAPFLSVPRAYADAGSETGYYVAPDGNDGNDGSLEHPFHTLRKARDVIRSLNVNMSGDIVVYVRGGEYSMSDTLEFSDTDSGTNGHRIVYRNYPGEQPVFSGGQRIAGWVEEGGLWKANVPGMKFRDLWVNGQRAARARSPSFKIVSWDDEKEWINIDQAAVAAWGAAPDPQLEVVINQHWVRSYARLDSFHVHDGIASLELTEKPRTRLFTDQYPDRAANQSVHFENSRLYLDEPGEWLLDEANETVYYKPRQGETLSDLDARTGAIETFVSFKGSDKNHRVANVELSGITFEYTKYQLPIDQNYIVPGQAGLAGGVYGGSTRQPAAIELEAADHITLARNVIRHTGATAIDIRGSSRYNEVVGNAITDIGGSGIFEGLFSEPGASTTDPLLITKGNVIRDNYLNGISLTSCGVGIISGFSQDVLIEHNEVANTDYTGISLGWGWTANDTSLMNNVVRANNIYGVMMALADGAAIYTLSKTPNSQIAGNYIHDIDSNEYASNYPVAAIYLDQATWGYTIKDNVLTRVGQTFYANVVADEGNTLTNNDSQDQAIIANAGLEPAYWDIVPGADMNQTGGNVTAAGRGSLRISGTAAWKDENDGSVPVTIAKNGTPVWSGNAAKGAPATYNLNIDVEPDDVVSFSPQDKVSWQSRVKPEWYTPRLVIDSVSFSGMKNEAPKVDFRNKIITVIANPDVDIHNLDVAIRTPPGTRAERVGGASKDFSSGAVYKIVMNDGSHDLGFDGGVKYKIWKLKVLLDAAPVSVDSYNLANQLADTDNWAVQGGTKTAGTNGITFNGGYTLYQGRKFGDELLAFNMKTSDSGWPSIVFRVQDDSKDPIGAGSAAYITVIRPTGIELQRFNDGVRTVFYGNVGGTPSKFGDAVPNIAFDFAKDNLVQVGATNTSDGVRLAMYINGKPVFDCLDNFDGKIETPGYFGTYQADNVIQLSKAAGVGSEDGPGSNARALLALEVTKAQGALNDAVIGSGYGEYPQWAKEYVDMTIGKVQSVYENDAATSAELEQELALLKSAEQVFAKARNVPDNIALGKPTTSSEAGNILVGYGPDKAVDDVVGFGNGWSAESGSGNWPADVRVKPWLTIDLGAAYAIDQVEVVARPNGNYDGERKTFQIQASNDPGFATGSYTVLGEVGTTPFEGASWLLDVTDGYPYRYIRYAKQNVDYAFVSELRVLSRGTQELHSVSGVLRSASGLPVSGATVSIYSFDDQQKPLGTAVSGADGSYTLSPSLPAGKYEVKAVAGDGIAGSGIVFIPYADVQDANLTVAADISIVPGKWAIDAPEFTDADGNPVDRLTASAQLNASVRMTNLQSQPQQATLIVALYAPDGSLVHIEKAEQQVPALGASNVHIGFMLPAQIAGYSVKAFVWNSLDRMQPLSSAVLFP